MKDSDVLFPLKVSFEYGHLILSRQKEGRAAKIKNKQRGGGSPQTCAEIKGSQKLTAGVAGTTFSPAETDSVFEKQSLWQREAMSTEPSVHTGPRTDIPLIMLFFNPGRRPPVPPGFPLRHMEPCVLGVERSRV